MGGKQLGDPPVPRGAFFFVFVLEKRKVLRIAWNGEKISQNFFSFFCLPPLTDMCDEKFLLVSIGGWAEGQACTDPGARTPIGACGNFSSAYHRVRQEVMNSLIRFKVWHRISSSCFLSIVSKATDVWHCQYYTASSYMFVTGAYVTGDSKHNNSWESVNFRWRTCEGLVGLCKI